uniref:Tryptophan synthase beta chain-like PALP domain-containing protein n=1 Tax=Mucochytrium quahogii TaxID=96639 RepID=A0A7S2R815_9STRA|mmetsp:Transcript_8089/g.13023  ORF Transcript_8089/g.13023 Transcript_8089/m.13023 type:complete len:324 (+) Transcript_8089:188-1159(+)|eukprot:CAMPEP_0203758200 /NCGR_PEP_ID=MMETSP0098-20131031/10962_1 /ASSEMBLY_ACC=CAM_ASM_000208 /TAXON_ID=96639 /ORGANISM=" , Strain NY0313808BC1" /LENGTH=323 /DNA_ID=CAMNT_0050650495 /DNA_START=188 /DNA_END=1159 /DNA_ORIENTATION=+
MVEAKDIEETARLIHDHVNHTGLEISTWLSQSFGANVYVKNEQTQYSGSFKLRGATNHIMNLTAEQREKGVVTASTGNHGIAVAYACSNLGIKCTIFLCDNIPKVKVDAISRYGAAHEFVRGTCIDAEKKAREVSERDGSYYVAPYNHVRTIQGTGTLGLEIWNQMKSLNKKIDAVFCCIGGGGLASGIATYLKAQDPAIKIYACSSERTPAMYESIKAGKIVTVESQPSIADGNGGNLEKDSITFDICKNLLEEIILVNEEEIADAFRIFFKTERSLVEPTGVVSFAGYIKRHRDFQGQNVVIVTCGRNVNMSTFTDLLQED